MRTIRDRLHPPYHARRLPMIRAALARLDLPVWAKLELIDWPVRVRAVRHASYLVRAATPEREIAALACAIVDVLPICHFCDVGANFGYYSWPLKSRFPELAVDLIEPEPENLALINATLIRTPLPSVSIHPVAASDVSGRQPFERDVVSGATGTLEPAHDSFARRHWHTSASAEVSTRTLDSLLNDRVDLLKIDVEGHEERVLSGAKTVLERDHPVLLFECFHGSRAAAAVLEARDYELFDAELVAAPTAATTNYLAMPARVCDQFPEVRDAWLGTRA